MTTTTAAEHLQLIARHWNDLHALRTTKPHDAWPPPSLNAYLRTVDEYDPADRSAPVRLHIIDTIRTVEAALVDTADATAELVQRPVIGATIGRGWSDEVHRQAVLLSTRDSADPRRWAYTGQRTGKQAARWLHGRLIGQSGPFRPLPDLQRERIALVAAGAAERVEHALGTVRRVVELHETCRKPTGKANEQGVVPRCGGRLFLEGGDGQPPTVRCADCSTTVGGRLVA